MSTQVTPPDSSPQSTPAPAHSASWKALTLGAIGVVYGDIGTSPLYTVKEVFSPATGVPLDQIHLIGAISAIFWALMLVVTLKYVILILRADNRGEGGIMALTALAAKASDMGGGSRPGWRRLILLTGVFGATLFYGDAIITPAISVLSAVEGLEVATPALKSYVIPITVTVLIGLFLMQRWGTGLVGKLFGPVIVLWFVVLGGVGLMQILREPAILAALNPMQALSFLHERGPDVLAALGAIVLAVTGAEALYADMGHFGRLPIRLAWSALVMPGLALNYLGQGALLMHDPAALENPFFRLFPESWVLPAVLLATAATVIASQAVISGAYSMTRQAIQLGFLPRMEVQQTSAHAMGQIYIPLVNWVLLAAVLVAVAAFGSSSALAAAYGIAVTLTMLITTVLTFFVVRHAWHYPLIVVLLATGSLVAMDALMVASCSIKFMQGGWFPLGVGLGLFLLMATWARGRALLLEAIQRNDPPLEPFVALLAEETLQRTPRTAVYAVANPNTVPQALLHNLKHNHVLHEHNIILTVRFHERPSVAPEEQVILQALAPGFWRVTVHYGFKDSPNIPEALSRCAPDLLIEASATSYFLSREIVVPTPGSGMALWREALFATMARNAGSVADYFRLPDNAVIELGTRVQI
ncbi:MAG: potassium transporter Kup [Leptothrix ochracea]|uniref:potassium transporter Kup n=1 Tax=Leptothrix ochracea TaxID=735331 RepID=UPI0034E2E07C